MTAPKDPSSLRQAGPPGGGIPIRSALIPGASGSAQAPASSGARAIRKELKAAGTVIDGLVGQSLKTLNEALGSASHASLPPPTRASWEGKTRS